MSTITCINHWAPFLPHILLGRSWFQSAVQFSGLNTHHFIDRTSSAHWFCRVLRLQTLGASFLHSHLVSRPPGCCLGCWPPSCGHHFNRHSNTSRRQHSPHSSSFPLILSAKLGRSHFSEMSYSGSSTITFDKILRWYWGSRDNRRIVWIQLLMQIRVCKL